MSNESRSFKVQKQQQCTRESERDKYLSFCPQSGFFRKRKLKLFLRLHHQLTALGIYEVVIYFLGRNTVVIFKGWKKTRLLIAKYSRDQDSFFALIPLALQISNRQHGPHHRRQPRPRQESLRVWPSQYHLSFLPPTRREWGFGYSWEVLYISQIRLWSRDLLKEISICLSRFIIYSVNKEEYDSCMILTQHPKIIAMCDKPFQFQMLTLSFR